MVYNDIAMIGSSKSVGFSLDFVANPKAYITDYNIVCLDSYRITCNTYSTSRSCLSGNGQAIVHYLQGTVQKNVTRNIEHHGTCPFLIYSISESSFLLSIFECGNMIYLTPSSSDSVSSESFSSRKSRKSSSTVSCNHRSSWEKQ